MSCPAPALFRSSLTGSCRARLCAARLRGHLLPLRNPRGRWGGRGRAARMVRSLPSIPMCRLRGPSTNPAHPRPERKWEARERRNHPRCNIPPTRASALRLPPVLYPARGAGHVTSPPGGGGSPGSRTHFRTSPEAGDTVPAPLPLLFLAFAFKPGRRGHCISFLHSSPLSTQSMGSLLEGVLAHHHLPAGEPSLSKCAQFRTLSTAPAGPAETRSSPAGDP